MDEELRLRQHKAQATARAKAADLGREALCRPCQGFTCSRELAKGL